MLNKVKTVEHSSKGELPTYPTYPKEFYERSAKYLNLITKNVWAEVKITCGPWGILVKDYLNYNCTKVSNGILPYKKILKNNISSVMGKFINHFICNGSQTV